MAEEPQPSNIHEGASEPQAPAGSAEDRKAAAALSSLDAQDDDSSAKKDVDSKALGEAMKNLSVKDKGAGQTKKMAVKIDPADVSFLVRPEFNHFFYGIGKWKTRHNCGLEEGNLTVNLGLRTRAPESESDRPSPRE